MKPSIFTISAAVFMALSPLPAKAEQVCMMAGEMKAALIDGYGERPIAQPTDNKQQLWASAATGSWTMLRFYSDGSACVIAQGDNWTRGVKQTEMLALLAE